MADGPHLAGSGATWAGASALKGGKGYAPGRFGQIHYRSMGDGAATPFLLIHQTPFGIAEFIDVQPALARMGRPSITSDNPGYGFSDPTGDSVTMADLADNLAALLDYLKVDKAVVAGHHTGAAIAGAFAARHKDRTAGLVLHGTPLYTAAERAERLARPSPSPVLKPDGSHLSDAFQQIYKYADHTPESLATTNWGVLGALMSGSVIPVYKAVFANDMTGDLAAIVAPTLVLTDTQDTLHAADEAVVALRPVFTLQTFSQAGSFALMREPLRWAQIVADFARANGI